MRCVMFVLYLSERQETVQRWSEASVAPSLVATSSVKCHYIFILICRCYVLFSPRFVFRVCWLLCGGPCVQTPTNKFVSN